MRAEKTLKKVTIFLSFGCFLKLFSTTWIPSSPHPKLLNNKQNDAVPFVLTICKGGTLPPDVSNVSSDEIQLQQAAVLLKSAAALTSERITFVLLCDDFSTFESIANDVSTWPVKYQELVSLQYRPIYTPPNPSVLQIYAPCALESLFLPWALPHLEAVIYLDTDTFFLRPPQHLIDVFKDFDDKQTLGAAPVDGYYLQYTTSIPFYGSKGLSSTLLLANLTRWRQLPFDWLTTMEAVLADYGELLTTGDQDVLNIIFSEYPEYIHDVGCEWVGVIEQCKTTNWGCDAVRERGFSMVHGARWRFFRKEIMGRDHFIIPLHVLFRAWQQHVLGTPVSRLLKDVLKELTMLEQAKLSSGRGLGQSRPDTHYFCRYDFRRLFITLEEFVARTEQLVALVY